MSAVQPPRPTARPQTVEHHGHRRVDEYAWLRDPNWREAMQDPDRLAPEIREYLEAENHYCDAVMKPTAGLRESLYRELRGRIREDDASVPDPDGPWHYYSRFRTGGQHPILCRQPRDGGEEQVLLDGDAEAEGKEYFQLLNAEHSPDHRWLAWASDTTGSEVATLRFRDLETGKDLDECIEGARGDVEWAADSRTLFFTLLDDEHRSRWIHRHRLGDDPKQAPLVYEETDAGFFTGVGKTESARFIVIDSHDHCTSELRILPADTPEETPRLIAERETGIEYGLSDHGDHWLILTNDRGAEDFRIARAPLDKPEREHWEDLIAHRPGRLIEDMVVFRNWLVRMELEDGMQRIVVRRMDSGEEHTIAFEEACHELGVSPGYEYDTDTLRFRYSSFATPPRVYDYDMATRERVLRKEREVPSGHNPADYVSCHLHARAPDGEAVPISLFHHRDTQPGPDTPLLLYGYGAYGMTSLPGFSTNRLSLVNRGFVYAIAHVRGGMERGYRWYRQGKLADKPNTFSDYIACAEHLIAEGYTGKGRIAAHGGSAGGMLVGAVLNQRPELFHAAIADVPFVDVLNTMLDETLPLTPPEWPEWGNPRDDEVAYQRILAYSPYDNVAAQDYPHLLVTAGVSDPRVTYWEPAKWVARLRARRTDDHLLLLKTNMSAGHGGAAGRFDFLEEVALRYAFLLLVYGYPEARG